MNRRKERESYRAEGKGYYHFCTDGLKGGLLFYDVSEFAYGMMLSGLVSIKFEVKIYAFVLMPNHVHMIVHGTGEACLHTFDYLKKKISARLSRDHHDSLPKDYWFKLVPIQDQEQIKSEIIYVLRNPLEKGLSMVGGYYWGSEWVYYSDFSRLLGGTRAEELSKRRLIKLFTTEDSIPAHWRIHPYLGLLPDSFVDTSLVRELFPSPKDLQTALVKDYELIFQVANRLGEICEFSKCEIAGIVSQTLQKRFGGRELRVLSEQDKGKLAIILHREFGLNSYQISTSIFIKEKVVRQLLTSKEVR